MTAWAARAGRSRAAIPQPQRAHHGPTWVPVGTAALQPQPLAATPHRAPRQAPPRLSVHVPECYCRVQWLGYVRREGGEGRRLGLIVGWQQQAVAQAATLRSASSTPRILPNSYAKARRFSIGISSTACKPPDLQDCQDSEIGSSKLFQPGPQITLAFAAV